MRFRFGTDAASEEDSDDTVSDGLGAGGVRSDVGADANFLELTDVKASYGRTTAPRRINLAVPTGSVVALLGPTVQARSVCRSAIELADCAYLLIKSEIVFSGCPPELQRTGLLQSYLGVKNVN